MKANESEIPNPRCGFVIHYSSLVILALLGTTPAHGQLTFDFVKIADTSTAVPGATGNFAAFIVPANNGTNVAFRATGGGLFGIYQSINGVLTRVADRNTPVPGGAGTFSDMEYPSVRGTSVVFYAEASSGSFLTQEGIYRGNGGSLEVIADRSRAIPSSSGNFSFFGVGVSSFEGGVFFTGGGQSSSQAGAYLYNGSSLIRVADTTTPIPSGVGNFTGFIGPSMHGTNLALRGLGNNNQDGIYLGTTNGLARVADKSTAIPSGLGMFTSFGTPSVSGTNVAFQGFGTNGQIGIYFGSTGTVFRVADTNTLIPGTSSKFVGFGSSALGYPTSCDGLNVAFLGSGGLYLYTGADGALYRVVTGNMVLGGKQVSLINFNQEGLSGNSIAFWASFSDGTVGIWKAVFSTPLGPRLRIEPVPLNSVRLIWPTNDPAFGLQFNTNLESLTWSLVPQPPVIIGTNNVVTNAVDQAKKFYRLRKP